MKKTLALVAFAFLAVACDKNHKNIFSNPEEALKNTGLQDKAFQSDCNTEAGQLIKGLIAGQFTDGVKTSRTEWKFEVSNVTKTTYMYSGVNCDGEAYTVVESGTFKIDKDSKTNEGARNIDFDFDKMTVKINSEPGATAANAMLPSGLCGKNDWSKDKEAQDVTAQSKDASCFSAKLPRKNFNIYKLDAEKILLLGNDGDADGNARTETLSNVKYTAK